MDSSINLVSINISECTEYKSVPIVRIWEWVLNFICDSSGVFRRRENGIRKLIPERKGHIPHDSQRTDHEVVIYIGDPTLDVSLEHTRSGSVYRN